MASDTSALLAIGTAAMGAIGALAGVGLGGWLESRRDERRREYERSIRFHDERLTAYAAHWRAVTLVFTLASGWAENGGNGSLKDAMLGGLREYAEVFGRVRLLATPAVNVHVAAIHSCIGRLMDEPPVETVRAIDAESVDYRIKLETAMRAELGIK